LAPQTLSIGIVGAGSIVSRVHLPVLATCEGIRLAYVADKRPEAARRVGAAYRIPAIAATGDEDALPPTDVVLLAIPVTARAPYYELFARRGACVLAEKPLAVTAAEAERLCGLYPEYALACGFQRRSYATAGLARTIIAQNWLGPLRAMSMAEGALTTKTGVDARFYDDVAVGAGGALMDLGCHGLDLAIYLTGASAVSSLEQQFVFDGEVDREMRARMVLATPRGLCALDYLVTWLQPTANVTELRFDHCTVSFPCYPADSLEIRDLDSSLPAGAGSSAAASLTSRHAGASTVYQAFYMEWTAFLDGVRRRQPSMFSARSCLPVVRAVEALYAAGREGQAKS
jgi:predicted dehydrogenase